MSRVGWGIALDGGQFDLELWQETLKPPYDPWVVTTERGLVLRSATLDAATSSSEAYDLSEPLLDLLNGAFAVSHQAQTVKNHGIVEFMADGSERRHVFARGASLVMRVRTRATAVVIGPDGKPKPPPPPEQSKPQQWLQIAATDEILADALTYYSRGDDWFDIFKALECLFLRFGGEKQFLDLGWASKSQIELLRRTANNERHARLKNKSIPNPMDRSEARQLLSTLITRAFQEVGEPPQDSGS